jgi:hypothetical protein
MHSRLHLAAAAGLLLLLALVGEGHGWRAGLVGERELAGMLRSAVGRAMMETLGRGQVQERGLVQSMHHLRKGLIEKLKRLKKLKEHGIKKIQETLKIKKPKTKKLKHDDKKNSLHSHSHGHNHKHLHTGNNNHTEEKKHKVVHKHLHKHDHFHDHSHHHNHTADHQHLEKETHDSYSKNEHTYEP